NKLYLRQMGLRLHEKGHLESVRDELDTALKCCPESAELYGDAADLCAAAGHFTPAFREECLNYLERAVKLGLPLGIRPKQIIYEDLVQTERLQSLQSGDGSAGPAPSARLIDPLNDRTPNR